MYALETLRRRRFGLRKYVLTLAVLFMLEMFLIEGRGPSMYLFLRKRFQWDAALFGRFLAVLGVLGVLTQYIAVPILTERLGIRSVHSRNLDPCLFGHVSFNTFSGTRR